MRASILALGIAAGLAASGCSPQGQQVGQPARQDSIPADRVDTSTPDKALKSYWAIRDNMRRRIRNTFEANLGAINGPESELTSVMTRQVADDIRWKGLRELETFSRDIIEVKTESESRAIVFAVIKNTTPIPAGAEVTPLEAAERRDGDRYKYVLEKEQGGWRVAEVWSWYDAPKAKSWYKSRPTESKPFVPSGTSTAN